MRKIRAEESPEARRRRIEGQTKWGLEQRRALCERCGSEFVRKPGCTKTRFCSKPCSNAHNSEVMKRAFAEGRTHSEEQRRKMSESLKRAHAEGRAKSKVNPAFLAAGVESNYRRRGEHKRSSRGTPEERAEAARIEAEHRDEERGRKLLDRFLNPVVMGPPVLRTQGVFVVCSTRRCQHLYVRGTKHKHADRVCVRCGGVLPHQQRHLCDDCGLPRKRTSGYAKKISIEKLGERDGWVCQLCGGEVPRDLEWDERNPPALYPTRDHVIPFAMGGSDALSNLQLAHWRCNVERQAAPVRVGE